MSRYHSIDYRRAEDTIRRYLHQHFSTERAVLSWPAGGIGSRKWTLSVFVPNMPMTMTFYGPSRIQALRNAAHLLQYYIKGPGTEFAR